MTTATSAPKPAAMSALAAAYGPPSQAAFGSAVFYEPQPGDADPTTLALAKYKYFVGDLWEQYG